MARPPKSSLTRLDEAQRRVDQADAAVAAAQRILAQAEKARDEAFEKELVKLARAEGLDQLSSHVLGRAIRSLGGIVEELAMDTSRARTASAERAIKPARLPGKPRAPRDDSDTVMVSVRFTSNGSGAKKHLLQEAGLTWNGKRGVHRGRVDEAVFVRLNEVFGSDMVTVDPTDRVPARVNASDPPNAADGGSTIHEAGATESDKTPPTEGPAEVDRGRREIPPREVADDTSPYVCADLTDIITAAATPTSTETLSALVGAVVEKEGPIHRDLVCDRIRAALTLPRLPLSLKTTIDEIIAGLPRDPRVEDDEGFLLLPGMPIRPRDRHGATNSIRHYDHLPLSELRIALIEAPTRDGATSEEQLIKVVGRRLGYDLVSHGLAARIRKALEVGSKI